MPTREEVMDALLVQLQTAGDVFKTYTRRWVPWIDDPQARCPDLPLLVSWESPVAENYERSGRGLPPTRYWDVRVLLYAKIPEGMTLGVPDSTTPGATVINPLIDAVESALDPGDKDGLQTLGGLVVDCRIEGTIVKALGDADPSGICGAIVPVRILVQ